MEDYFHIVSYIRKHLDKDQYLLRGGKGVVFKTELLKLIEEKRINLKLDEHLSACIELDKKYNMK
jgi:hypothetical protein